jgi:hypothetical protein
MYRYLKPQALGEVATGPLLVVPSLIVYVNVIDFLVSIPPRNHLVVKLRPGAADLLRTFSELRRDRGLDVTLTTPLSEARSKYIQSSLAPYHAFGPLMHEVHMSSGYYLLQQEFAARCGAASQPLRSLYIMRDSMGSPTDQTVVVPKYVAKSRQERLDARERNGGRTPESHDMTLKNLEHLVRDMLDNPEADVDACIGMSPFVTAVRLPASGRVRLLSATKR